jgi:RluA family pseudouridine synthase
MGWRARRSSPIGREAESAATSRQIGGRDAPATTTSGRPASAAAAIARRLGAPPSLGLADRVLYRDGDVLVIDKPTGVAVHTGPGGGANLEDHLGEVAFGLPRPPGLAHRLDRDTAGCLVLGRHPRALRRLNALFASGRVAKTYWAVVVGGPDAASGEIDLALAKVARPGGGWRMVADPLGKPARTRWRQLARGASVSLLELEPATGRTHQIRVHCASMGWPVLGDPAYGEQPLERPSLQLLARRVALPWRDGAMSIDATAPVPPHMSAWLQAAGAAIDLLRPTM